MQTLTIRDETTSNLGEANYHQDQPYIQTPNRQRLDPRARKTGSRGFQ